MISVLGRFNKLYQGPSLGHTQNTLKILVLHKKTINLMQ
jgi:hypothetical protein